MTALIGFKPMAVDAELIAKIAAEKAERGIGTSDLMREALHFYFANRHKPRNDPPPTSGPQAPLDTEGIQPILEGLEAICEEVRAIGPAIGLSVAAALQGSGFSVNQAKSKKAAKPAKPKATIYGAKAIEPPPGLLDSIADGMADWAVAQGG